MPVYLGQRTDSGLNPSKKNNEDSVGNDLNRGLFVVADGVGGAELGEYASSLVVSLIKQYIAAAKPNYQDRKNAIVNAIKVANNEIAQRMSRDGKQIGTTVTALLIGPGKYFIAHVGDSRAYLIRNEKIVLLTKDHSKVQQMADGGVITQEEARKHPMRNYITRWVGIGSELEVDPYEGEFKESDIVLLCSDGLWEPVSDLEILEVIRNNDNPQDACNQMIDLANHYGGPDNISAVIAKSSPTAIQFKPSRRKKTVNIKQLLVPAIVIVILTIFIILLINIFIPKIAGIFNKPKLKEIVFNIYENSGPMEGVTIKNSTSFNKNLNKVIIKNNQNDNITTSYIGDIVFFIKKDYDTIKYEIPDNITRDTTIIVNMEKTPVVIKPQLDTTSYIKPVREKPYTSVDLILSGFDNKGKPTEICGAQIWIDGQYIDKQVTSTKKGTTIPNLKLGTYKIAFKKNGNIIAYKNVTVDGSKSDQRYDANAYNFAPGK